MDLNCISRNFSGILNSVFFFSVLYLLIFLSLCFLLSKSLQPLSPVYCNTRGLMCLGNTMTRYLVIALQHLGESLILIVSGVFPWPLPTPKMARRVPSPRAESCWERTKTQDHRIYSLRILFLRLFWHALERLLLSSVSKTLDSLWVKITLVQGEWLRRAWLWGCGKYWFSQSCGSQEIVPRCVLWPPCGKLSKRSWRDFSLHYQRQGCSSALWP